MRILKLFKKHILALFAAIVLIVISCNADLALPTYMSDIVDVGVQQGGIASPVPDTIRAESLDDLELFMSTKDAKTVEAAFGKADKNGIRTYKGTEEERADGGKIADIMSLPETVVLSLDQGIDADSMGDMMGSSSEKDNNAAQAMPTPEQMAAMTPEQLAEMQQKAAAAQSMQKQIDADGVKIKVWDAENKTSDGFDGWYNPENAVEELNTAIEELAEDGITIDESNPIQIEYPYPSAVEVYTN